MKTFYVATLARYVLVDAADETEAASLGQDALHALYADLRAMHGRDIPIEIRTIRLANGDGVITRAQVRDFLINVTVHQHQGWVRG